MKRLTIRASAGAALAAGGLMFAFHAAADQDKLQKMDTNNDGMVSATEYEAAWRDKFGRLDTNGDGSVTVAEMEASHRQATSGEQAGPSQHSGAKMSSAEEIRALDRNNDGTITAAEHAEAAREKFTKMDTNGDGNLSAAELQAGATGMKSERTY